MPLFVKGAAHEDSGIVRDHGCKGNQAVVLQAVPAVRASMSAPLALDDDRAIDGVADQLVRGFAQRHRRSVAALQPFRVRVPLEHACGMIHSDAVFEAPFQVHVRGAAGGRDE